MFLQIHFFIARAERVALSPDVLLDVLHLLFLLSGGVEHSTA